MLSSFAVKAQSDTSLIFLKSIDSTIVIDVKYATTDNFTHTILYATDKVYLRLAAAKQLAKANQLFKEKYGYRIKVFDGYRPLSVQKFMWKVTPDKNYVANPAVGSKHNRGAAVDCTLIDSTGAELEMGTSYDSFTEKAHSNNPNISAKAKSNRKLFKQVMGKFGFRQIDNEWWHFDFKGWARYSILDIEIK